MRLSRIATCVAALALVMSAPAFARNGGGHHGGGHGGGHYSKGFHGGGQHFRGGGQRFSHHRGGQFRNNFGHQRFGGFGHRGFGRGGFGHGGFHHGGFYRGPSIGVGFGFPYYGGFYDPFYYPRSSTIIVREGARDPGPAFPSSVQAGPGEPPRQIWYFCQDSNQYYPYVRSCASAWQEVPAVPPPAIVAEAE